MDYARVTFFMTQKVTVSFVVGLTYFLTLKGQGVIWGLRDLLYDPKGHGDLIFVFVVGLT